MCSKFSRFFLSTLILAAIAAAHAKAELNVLAHYRLGENDPGAVAGGTVSTSIESLGLTPDRHMVSTFDVSPLLYSSDTPSYTTSSLSVQFNNTETHLSTEATPWYQPTGGFRWGMEAFLKPDASLAGAESIFFTNGTQFTMGMTADGFFYVNQTGPGTTPVKYGQWQHVAFFTTGSFWQIYVDGVPQFATLPNFNYGVPSGIATLGDDNAGDILKDYSGLIDEHRIFTWTGAFNPNELLWYQLRPAGDVNEDGSVNAIDYDIWRQNVGADLSALTALQGRARGDLNGDRQVDLVDFGIIKDNKTPGSSFVPEPDAAAILLAGAAAAALRRKRAAAKPRIAAMAGLALVVALLHPGSVSAQAVWGGGSGNWNDANWSGGSGAGGAPAAGDSIVLPPSTGTITVSNNIGLAFNAMNQQGGILDIQSAGALEFTGLFENGKGAAANGGEVNIAGELVIGGGFDVARDTLGSVRVLESGILNVSGTMDTWWAPGAVFDIAGGNDDISIGDTFFLGPSATINANISSTAFSPVKVSNTLSIQGGSLNANFIGGFVPSLGNSWTLFDATNRSGQIINVNATGLSPGTRLNVNYAAGGTLGQVVTLSVAPTLNLKVDAATGNLFIENPAAGAAALAIDGYIIRSASNALDPAGFSGVGQAGWLPGLPPSQSDGLLSETSFGGSLSIAQGASYSLGSAFDGSSVEDQDLTFEFRLSNGEILQGSVQYEGAPGFAADFNGVGGVNGADLAIWKGGFGMASGAAKADGDYDSDGDVDGSDFLGWQRELGLGVSPATPVVGAVPEPASMVLLAMTALGAFASRGRCARW